MRRLGCLVVVLLLTLVIWYSGVLTDVDWKQAADDALETFSGFVVKLAGEKDTVLVNADHPLPDDFETGELVRLSDQTRSFSLASDDIYLERRAYEAAEKMFAAAQKAGVSGFVITAGYEEADERRAACGEHQTGLAFDVAVSGGDFAASEQYDWISRNCWKYGFILRYPEGAEDITGVAAQPQHYRYVGLLTSALTTLTGRTLEEVVS